MRETRREVLKKVPLIGFPSTVTYSTKTNPYIENLTSQSVDLLPADNAVEGGIRETSSATDTTVDGEISADPNGALSSFIEGSLNGEGQLALSGSPFIETEWTAPSDGLYRVLAGYSVTAEVHQQPYSEDTTQLASTLVSNSGTIDPTRTVVRDRSREEWSLRTQEYSEETLKTLLGYLTKRLISPYLGPLGGVIAGFILKVVFNVLMDPRRGFDSERSWDEQVSSDFMAEEGETYQLRFTPVSGISGRSESADGGFNAGIAAEYSLGEFRLQPVSGLPEKEIVIYHSGNGGEYRFSVTGSLRGSSDLTIEDSVKTTSPLFSDEEHRQASGSVDRPGETDTYYYTGDIKDWSLTGSAKMFINDERWFPFGGGPEEHELRIEHTGDGGRYSFSVTGSLRGGPDLSIEDSVKTSSPLFSDEEYRQASGSVDRPGETDTYYYTGDIKDWSLTGSAKMFINDERWFPHG